MGGWRPLVLRESCMLTHHLRLTKNGRWTVCKVAGAHPTPHRTHSYTHTHTGGCAAAGARCHIQITRTHVCVCVSVCVLACERANMRTCEPAATASPIPTNINARRRRPSSAGKMRGPSSGRLAAPQMLKFAISFMTLLKR